MKKSLYTAACFLGTLTLQAQTNDSTITRAITIEREFMPTIESSGKIHSQPKVFTPQISPKAVVYTDVAKPFVPSNEIDALAHAQASFKEPIINKGFVRGGFGMWNGLFDFGYTSDLSKSTYIDLMAHHDGVYDMKLYANSTLGLQIGKRFKTSLLTFGVNGRNEFFNYYGVHFNDTLVGHYDIEAFKRNDSITNRFWSGGTHLAIQSLPEARVNYKAQIGYQLFNAEVGLTEHQINTVAHLNWRFRDARVGGNFSMQNLIYSNTLTGVEYPSHHIIHVEPYYHFSNNSITTHIGLNFDLSIQKGLYFAPSPNIDFEWRIKPNYWAIYAQLNGEYRVNTMQKSLHDNRYLNPLVHLTDTLAAYTPLNANFGVKIKPFKDLLIRGYFGYKYTYNDYYYIPSKGGRFGIEKTNSNCFTVGGSAEYHYKNRLRIELGGKHMAWNLIETEYNWDRPSWEAYFTTEINATDKLRFFVNCFFIGERIVNMGNQQPYTIKPVVDLNVGAGYSFTKRFSAFVKLNNLTHNLQGEFYGYETQGFNSLVGVSWQF